MPIDEEELLFSLLIAKYTVVLPYELDKYLDDDEKGESKINK